MRKLLVVAAILSAACGGSNTDGNPPGTPQTAATPTFSVPAGVKNAPISVTIASTTPGAVVHYTTNGVDPTAASSTFTSALSIATATTLKAIATATGYADSAVASAAYTFVTAPPTFSVAAGTYLIAQSVALTTLTPGASVYYTTDGSTPTASSTLYAGPISLSVDPSTTTIKAIAIRAGFTDSAVASGTYTIDSTATQVATPTFSPVAGTYGAAQDVTIACATGGATIYYTTNGTDPTVLSSIYASPLHLTANVTLKAMAKASGHPDSAVGSAAYVINLPQTAAPTFSPAAGTYGAAQNVTISTTTASATIYYTTDGSTPTPASAVYSAPVAVTSTKTLKAMATAPDHTPSTVSSALYTITLPVAAAPTFSPAAGSYSSAQSVTISSATPGAVIHYTTNGTTPTSASPTFGGAIAVSTTTTLKAIATATGYADSAVATATYTIGGGLSCGSSDVASLCTCMFDKIKSLEASCLKVNPDFFTAYAGTGGCADAQKEVDAGLVTYNASAGATCQADVAAMTCSSLFTTGDFTFPASCQSAYTGTVANGTGVANQCYSDENCANGYCDAVCPGHCKAFATAGQDCSSTQCAAGLDCDYSAVTPVCVAVHGAGGACPCQSGLWCNMSGGGAGVCTVPKTSGACSVFNDGECAVGYACFAPTSSDGTCVAFVGSGQPCTSNPCGLGYYCASGTCASSKGAGASCGPTPGFTGGTNECMSFSCASGLCTAVPADPVCAMP